MKNDRRKGALSRLELQLKSGNKNTNEGVQPLSEKDVARINNEIKKLKEKV